MQRFRQSKDHSDRRRTLGAGPFESLLYCGFLYKVIWQICNVPVRKCRPCADCVRTMRMRRTPPALYRFTKMTPSGLLLCIRSGIAKLAEILRFSPAISFAAFFLICGGFVSREISSGVFWAGVATPQTRRRRTLAFYFRSLGK